MSNIGGKSPEILRRNLLSTSGAGFVGFSPGKTVADLGDPATGKGADMIPFNSYRSLKNRLEDHVSVKDFGAIGDGITNDRVAVQTAIDYAADQGLPLYFTRGVYAIDPDVNGIALRFHEGSVWIFQGGELKLLSDTGPIGGFISSPEVNPPADFSKVRTDNVRIYDIVIDCNNIPGENAFGCFGSGLRLYNPVIKNVQRSTTRLGGRCFQFEGFEIEDNHIYNAYLFNIKGIGINAQASNSYTDKISRAISYHNVSMTNVDIPVNMDNTNEQTPADVGDERFMSTYINGLSCFNCGRPSWDNALPFDGGIITGDRGFGLRIDGLRVINDTNYGGIGALVRGTLFNFQLNDVSIEINYAEAIFNLTNLPDPTWSAAEASFQSTIYAKNVRCIRANLDYVVKTKAGGGALGACTFEDIQIDNSLASLSAAVDVNAAGYSNALLELVDARQGTTSSLRKTTGLVNLSSVNSIGLADMLRDKKLVSKTSWPVSDGSGGALVLAASDYFYTIDEGIINAWVTIGWPVTADTRPAYITGLPLTPIALIGKFPIESTVYNIRAVGNPSKAFEFFKDDGTAVLNSELSGRTIHIKATYRI
ncbi:glycosyl hydrolase family 28-related protein [Paremcibacter congregatus]|uniref:glycosyl hydrolase family 28-related protein n=1 Tax=Paremcibacter congregatus TaxID=2043170 RepID=UPI0030EDF13B|tara:strand:- start:18661 stop:20439 length:1779 start_codon:yes stop_codon:yes gene_type:complete